MNAGDPLIRPPELSKTPMSAMGSKSRYRFAAASPADCSRVESISRCPRAEGGYYTSTWEGGRLSSGPPDLRRPYGRYHRQTRTSRQRSRSHGTEGGDRLRICTRVLGSHRSGLLFEYREP